MASNSTAASGVIPWNKVIKCLNEPDGPTNAEEELRKARDLLQMVVGWIENLEAPYDEEIESVKNAIQAHRSGVSSDQVAIDMNGSPKTASPRRGWKLARNIASITRGRFRGSGRGKGGGQGGQGEDEHTAIEMTNHTTETKEDVAAPPAAAHNKTKGHGEHDTALPAVLEQFNPLGEIEKIQNACLPLRQKQQQFVDAYEANNGDLSKLTDLKRDLYAKVTELQTLMLEGIQTYIFMEDINDHLLEVVDAGNKHFLDVYTSVYHTIQNSEQTDINNYLNAVHRGMEKMPKGGHPGQTAKHPVELLIQALAVKNDYKNLVEGVIQGMIQRHEVGESDITFKAAPIKKLQRVVEKSMLKATVPGDASRTCDLVRGMAICKNMAIITKFVDALTNCKNLERVRLKDRFQNPSDGGWRDYMDNFIVRGCASYQFRHVCELQVVHKMMIVARKGLPGHLVYGKVRNAGELSLLYNGGSSKKNFRPYFWKGPQQAALAMAFIRCGGQHWNRKQKRGWCTTEVLSDWAGLKLKEFPGPNANSSTVSMVTSLDLSKRKLEGDGLMREMLVPLKRLEEINLKESSRHIKAQNNDDYESLGDNELEVIANACPNIRIGNFDFCAKITDHGLGVLASGCRNLEVLELQECDLVTDAGLEHLVDKCANLRRLNLKECDKITDAGLEILGRLNQLEELDLQDCDSITNDGLNKLKGCNIKLLNLNYCSDINDQGLANIARVAPKLESISLTELTVSDNGIKELCETCTNLKSISLFQCRRIGDQAITAIANNCKNFEMGDFQYCTKVGDNSLTKLAQSCPNLTDLKIRNCEKASNAVLVALGQNCTQLTQLDCFGCPLITDAGIQQAKQQLPALNFDR